MAVTLLFGCGKKEDAAKRRGADEDCNIRVPSPVLGVRLCSLSKRRVSERGPLNRNLPCMTNGPVAFQGMHGGDSQFCLLSQEPVLKAQQEGLDSSIIYTVLDTRLYGFVGASDITDVLHAEGRGDFPQASRARRRIRLSPPYSGKAGWTLKKTSPSSQWDYGASMSALEQRRNKASYINTDNRIEIKDMGRQYSCRYGKS